MKSDGAERQRPPDAPEEQRDGEQSELGEFREDFSAVTKTVAATDELVEQMKTLIASQGAAYAAAIRLALLASSFGSFAWMLTLLLIIFGNPIGALWVAVAFFGVLSVVFFWLAFNARFINWLKNKFERRRRK